MKFLVTKIGLEKIKQDIDNLKNVQRPAIIEKIESAREHGDLKENAEYHAAKEKQAMVESQIANLESKLSQAEVIDISSLSGSKVKFGATVKLQNIDTEQVLSYTILSEYEANAELGLISVNSPIAKELIGRNVGDEIEVITPKGEVYYEIMQVDFNYKQ